VVFFSDKGKPGTRDSFNQSSSLKCFKLQEPAFALNSPRIAAQTAVGSPNSMTRYDQAERIFAVGRSNSPPGFGMFDSIGKLCVGNRLAIRYAAQFIPDIELKRATVKN
jgi:hypothetical protein